MDGLMLLEYVGYFAFGVFVAAYGTLIGAGGGFIIVPLLLLLPFGAYPHELAVGTSLTVVFFNALSGTISYARQGRIDFWTGARFALITVPGSIIGATLTQVFSGQAFNIAFGVLLCAIALYLLLGGRNRVVSRAEAKAAAEEKSSTTAKRTYYTSPATNPLLRFLDTLWRGDGVVWLEGSPLSWGWRVHREMRAKNGEYSVYSYQLWPGILISFVVGFLSSILGIGGGIIHVPAMVAILDFPPHLSTATSHFILVISSGVGVVSHLLQPTTRTLPGFLTVGDVVILPALLMSGGAIIGAQVGAQLSKRLAGSAILGFLALALLLVGIRLILPLG